MRRLVGVRGIDVLGRCVGGSMLLLLASRLLLAVAYQNTMDDAYMYVRYAHNVLQHGCLCWNVPGAPTYGLTGPLYLSVTLPLLISFGAAPGLISGLSSVLSGCLLFALLGLLLWRQTAEATRLRGALRLVVLGLICLGHKLLAYHISSGMDTLFASAALTGLLLAHQRFDSNPTPGLRWFIGAFSALIFWARPDLLIYSFGIPLGIAVLTRRPGQRREMLAIVAIAGCGVGLVLAANQAMFGVPLPLPFYAKAVASYTGEILAAYRHTAKDELLVFVRHQGVLPLTWILSLLLLLRRGAWRAIGALYWAVFACSCVFVTYYLFFVLSIMSAGGRFYFPTVPAWALLATRGLTLLSQQPLPALARVEALLHSVGELKPRGERLLALVSGVALVSVLLLVGSRTYDAARFKQLWWFEDRGRYLGDPSYRNNWYRLDEISRLPQAAVLGTSEVGMPVALNPDRVIIDLVGLNDTAIVKAHFDPELLFTRYRMDAFYMPHEHYSDMLAAIRHNPMFRSDYVLYERERLGAKMGLAIRKASPYYEQLRAIAERGPP